METKIFLPPYGIQKTYIASTYVGNLKKLYGITGSSFVNLSGSGTGTTKDIAKKLSVFEAIERLGNTLNTCDIIVDTQNNLKEKCYEMSNFPQVASTEKSYNLPFDPDKVIGWVGAMNLMDGKEYLIPQNYVYLYNPKTFLGDRVTNPISTGVALHDTYTEAVIAGIYEVIERDGIALTWLSKHINYRINHIFNSKNDSVFSSKFLGEVDYYDVSTVDGVITVCAHARSNFSKNSKNVLMFASDINISNIKKKLFKELISVMSTFANNSHEFSNDTDFNSFTSVEHGGSFMAKYFNDSYFDFFKGVPDNNEIHYTEKTFISPKDELIYLKSILKRENCDVLVRDISSREAIEENLKVVRVIVPQLQPISFVYSSRFLNSKRLREYMSKHNVYEINKMPLAFS